ncbi:hypothetical protein IHQ71_06390 [Rhizobium sp. TH2]|uniref:hypothetical protein n=1 Tax=Rhizobium sp. TH2 TaxID=2775403 RepID=UPI0021574854|nr:hypothetical protein [Rhizobium sp. TH2]UVC10229.1 hypothetical protein IHQ71_06390 [Rhizobium sp. TH2]
MTAIISFSENISDWGAATWIWRAVVDHAAKNIDDGEWVHNMDEQLDRNIGLFRMGEVSIEREAEFIRVLEKYVEGGGYKELLPNESLDKEYFDCLFELVSKLKLHIVQRSAFGHSV